MGTSYTVKQHDYGLPLVADVSYRNTALDITDTLELATPAVFTMTPEGSVAPVIYRAPATITAVDTAAKTVTVQYDWRPPNLPTVSGDLEIHGRYKAELEFDLTAGPATAPTGGYLAVYILPDLDSTAADLPANTVTAIDAHVAQADPHPIYATDAAVATTYAPLASPTFTGTPTVPMLRLATIDPSGARYAAQQSTGTLEAGLYSDTSANWGYNVSTTPGVKAVAGEPLLFLQMESKFRQNSGSPYGSEFHLNYATPSTTTVIRPINLFLEHTTGLIDFALVADTFGVTKTDGTILLNYSAAGSWYARKPVIISTGTAAALTVGEAAGSATITLNSNAPGTNNVAFQRAGVATWLIYDAAGADLLIRNQVDAHTQIQIISAATDAAAFTDLRSNLRVWGPNADVGPSTNKITIGSLSTSDVWVDAASSSNATVNLQLRAKGAAGQIVSNTAHRFAANVGFYNAAPVAKPTGVAVSAPGIHAALVTLGLIAA